MEARLNRSFGEFSSGTRVLVLSPDIDEEFFPGFVSVELISPPFTQIDDVPEDVLTECRPTVEYIPLENRHKRRTKFQNPIDATGVGKVL